MKNIFLSLSRFSANKPLLQRVSLEGGVKPIAPFSIGTVVSSRANLVYLSGTIGVDPKTQELVSGDVQQQTKQTMNNISEVLKASNSSFEHVVKCNVYITDFANFQKMNEVYGTYFKGEFPSRTCVAVRALPKNALVEIEAIAVQKD